MHEVSHSHNNGQQTQKFISYARPQPVTQHPASCSIDVYLNHPWCCCSTMCIANLHMIGAHWSHEPITACLQSGYGQQQNIGKCGHHGDDSTNWLVQVAMLSVLLFFWACFTGYWYNRAIKTLQFTSFVTLSVNIQKSTKNLAYTAQM